MQAAQITSYTLSGFHAGCTIASIALGWWNPFDWYVAALNGFASGYWLSTANYLNNGFDYDYSMLLGSYAYEQRSFCYTKMVCSDNELPYELVKGKQNIAAPNPDDCYTEYVCENRTVAVPCPHDATVSTYSQLLDKTKGTNVIWAASTIKGVNHMEEFNHRDTRAEFKKAIVDGGYTNTFKK